MNYPPWPFTADLLEGIRLLSPSPARGTPRGRRGGGAAHAALWCWPRCRETPGPSPSPWKSPPPPETPHLLALLPPGPGPCPSSGAVPSPRAVLGPAGSLSIGDGAVPGPESIPCQGGAVAASSPSPRPCICPQLPTRAPLRWLSRGDHVFPAGPGSTELPTGMRVGFGTRQCAI